MTTQRLMSWPLHLDQFSHSLLSSGKAVLVLGTAVSIHLCSPLMGQSQWSNGSGGAIYYNGGNVAIGSSTPLYSTDALEVNGTLRLRGTNMIGFNTNGAIFYNPNGPSIAGVTGSVIYTGGSYENLIVKTPTTGPGGIGGAFSFIAGSSSVFTALPNGKVGIGTTTPQYTLAVNGTIGAKEVVVTNTGWADYVFKPGYRLKPLNDVSAYIREHHHLPDIPSETEVRESGVDLGEMQAKLLAKIEELTLHMIRVEEENQQLERHNRELQELGAKLQEQDRELRTRVALLEGRTK